MAKIRLAVLASGSGTNLQAIIDKCESGEIPAEVAVVLSNNADAYALARAKLHRIDQVVVNLKDFESRQDYDRKIVQTLKGYQVDLVVLAGYMLIVSSDFINAFGGKVINLHPALLPSFPGTDGIGDALKYGVKVTGVTVHFVDEGCDTGPIILQEAVTIREDDTRDTLAERIHEIEHRLLPEAIRLFAEGKLKREGRRVKITESRA